MSPHWNIPFFCFLLKLLGTGCADDKKRWVPAPLVL
jgi:hypothetical protein